MHPIDLSAPIPKGFLGGTHRLCAPEATLAQIRRVTPALGITRVANITGLDRIGIPVVTVCRPNARSLAVAQGKGLDLVSARVSGLMEAAESYVAERITLPLRLASYEELRYSHRAVDLDALPRARAGSLSPHRPIHWIEGYDLLGGEPVWLPFDLVHTNYTVAMGRQSSGLLATSNGLASGNHLLEAVGHGLYEVIERDALSMWYLLPEAQREARRVDPASVDDPACQEALARYDRAEVAVGIWEISSEIALPAFLCRIVDRHDSALRRVGYAEGMGCHPAREVALLRALTEAAQSRATLIAGARDDIVPAVYAQLGDPEVLAQRRAELARPALRRFAEAPSRPADTINADVAWALDQLRAAGLPRAIVVDLSRPELGLSVARVVVPGLEYITGKAGAALGPRGRARLGGR